MRQWEKVEANLTDDTPNLGFISCPGGTRVKCKPGRDDIQEITEGQVLFFEVDKGLTQGGTDCSARHGGATSCKLPALHGREKRLELLRPRHHLSGG